jgi:wyosine [tRNA(Phe)-imidazoG37] synthetase (radical SAM superfamily)
MSIVYGPVPSWRLGRSLGIDLLPAGGKSCTFDCIYCQLGRTTRPLGKRASFVSLETLEEELIAARGVRADYLTFSGMGEPTLAANLGEAIRLSRRILGLPVAVLTNSSLLTCEDVRKDLASADAVVTKLDAPDERLFRLISRPVADCSQEDVLRGIGLLRAEYAGKLALQMMFVRANKGRAAEMAALARQVSPDEVQINTPLRPSPTPPLPPEDIAAIRRKFGGLPVVAVYEAGRPEVAPLDADETLRRRPQARPGRSGGPPPGLRS